jgi:deoxycytidine triphosphate deaminase
MILTDVDIHRVINRDLVIYPCKKSSITPLGYDLSLGFAINLQTKDELRCDLDQQEIKIPARSSVFIITEEFIWLSPRLAVTLHSRGGLAAKGLVLNSTTIDPNWNGRLTMLLYNSSDQEVVLCKDETFSTAIFHVTKTPTPNEPSSNPIDTAKFYGASYSDWFSNKLVAFITDSKHNQDKLKFEALVRKASTLSIAGKIISYLQKIFPKFSNIIFSLLQLMIYFILAVAITIKFYWSNITDLLEITDPYDVKVMMWQITTSLVCILFLVKNNKSE